MVAFLDAHVDSVLQLELLLAMRDGGSTPQIATALSRQLRSPEAWTAQQLERLHAARLLACDRSSSEPAFWYDPQDSDLARTVARLAECFRHRKTRVVAQILCSGPATAVPAA